MSIRMLAISLALIIPVFSPALAIQAKDTKVPEIISGDPNEKVCETITMIGSRLAKRRFCGTRAEWADRRRQDRQAIEKAQVGVCVKRAGC
jgi:hypothetical protein